MYEAEIFTFIVFFQGLKTLRVSVGVSVFQVETDDTNVTQTHLSRLVNQALQVTAFPSLLVASAVTYHGLRCCIIFFQSRNLIS